jgi:hypothetical protein
MTVTNRAGTDIYLVQAIMHMDGLIWGELNHKSKIHNWTDQEYFTAYEIEHEKKYGEEWDFSKKSPVWHNAE